MATDAMEFFRLSAGRWQSQRTTHHLAFRRSELGESDIVVEALAAADPAVAELCTYHGVDPALAAGGALVSWHGRMDWDRQDEEQHKGSTVMVIVPDSPDGRRGRLLRERGYAEVAPVAGQYAMDAEDGLNLITEYETMSVVERFWFAAPDLRLRTSTLKRFGGFSTATFCAEKRVAAAAAAVEPQARTAVKTERSYSLWGW
nr:phycobiliprotein lyase [Gloeobacter morelensis]